MFFDSRLSQDLVVNLTKCWCSCSWKTHFYSIVTIFDPSFNTHCEVFEIFFLPSNTILKNPILLQAQKDDPVLFTGIKKLEQKQNPFTLTPVIKNDLNFYYKQFQHLYSDQNFCLIQYHTTTFRIFEELFTKTQPSINQIFICLPFEPSPLLPTNSLLWSFWRKTLSNLSTNFITLNTCIYGSLFFSQLLSMSNH